MRWPKTNRCQRTPPVLRLGVQIIKAVLLLSGVAFMAIAVMSQFNFSPEQLFAKAVEVKTAIAANGGAAPDAAAQKGLSIMAPGGFVKDPISAISFGMALMFGTAGLPHILMRFFTVPDAKEAQPKDIRFGDNLPKTRSGKIRRRLLRSVAKGEAITQDTSTLENPAILGQFSQSS